MNAPADVPQPRGSERADTVSALERGVAVLRCFSETQRLLSHAELARLTGIPRPTVTRLTATLVALGLLRQEAGSERYRLGAGVLSPARAFLAGLDVRASARPHMQALADRFGGSVYLAVRDGLDMVLIEATRASSSMLATRLDVGSRVPMANAALGRAYLAAIGEAERGALVASLRLARGTDWPALAGGLQNALEGAAACGWCLSIGEFHREINSVAVPLVCPQGEVMALNCGGAAYGFDEARLRDEVGPALRTMAATIAAEIGGGAPAEATR